jgi:hypothetical protein
MQLTFENHDEHDAFTQSADAVLAYGNLATALRSEVATVCPDCGVETDEPDDDEGDERSAYHTVNGRVEVRER